MDNIAVIMATYNGEKFLREQIDSILNNSYKNFTLYVCDDGSTDGTISIVEQYMNANPGKVILRRNKENKRVIRNFLDNAKEIDAYYYMLCDQDDVWLQNKIDDTFKFMKEKENENPNAPVVVFGDAQVVDGDLNELNPSFHKLCNLDTSKLSLVDLCIENKLIGCTMMFNRLLWEKLDVFPEDIRMHDWWIGLVGSAFGKVAYLNKPLLKYRQHGNNTVGGESEARYIMRNLVHLKLQREMLYAVCKQTKSFVNIYRDELDSTVVEKLDMFGALPEQNWFKRRHQFLHSEFRKTGFVRNFGMFVIM